MQRMTMSICLWGAFAWAALAQTPAVSPAPPAPGWAFPRMHFVFHNIVFDITYRMWTRGAQFETLADCSTAETHCLTSRTFSVALPKRCADLSAARWGVGNVRTEVLYRHLEAPPIHGSGSGETFYLGSPERPNQLFVYDPYFGVRALIWDESRQVDFVAMARAGNIHTWLSNRIDAERGHRYFPMITFDTVGACRR